tara:strand:+ start:77 stop:343 length:267 start_codon:yes stop_codon:yes gene_type:complete
MVCEFCKHEECVKTGTEPQNDHDVYECVKCYSDIHIEIFGSDFECGSSCCNDTNAVCHQELDGEGGQESYDNFLLSRRNHLLDKKENT